jgi:hypothetical protein
MEPAPGPVHMGLGSYTLLTVFPSSCCCPLTTHDHVDAPAAAQLARRSGQSWSHHSTRLPRTWWPRWVTCSRLLQPVPAGALGQTREQQLRQQAGTMRQVSLALRPYCCTTKTLDRLLVRVQGELGIGEVSPHQLQQAFKAASSTVLRQVVLQQVRSD